MPPFATPSPTRPEEPTLEIDVDGGLVRLRADYDPQLVERIRRLPDRWWIAERKEWVLPARKSNLAELAGLIAELEGRVTVSDRARDRLERHGPGRLDAAAGGFAVTLARPVPNRVAKVRAVSEAHYNGERREWQIPATRAGALELASLVAGGELVATPAATARLHRAAEGTPDSATSAPARDVEQAEQSRASPTPHWRHVTRGPVFEANPHRHEWVDRIGWCVRIRVEPNQDR